MRLFGRERIVTDKTITPDNVVDVVRECYVSHTKNKLSIDFLYNYYKGKQPILGRVKEVRPEICNRIVENRAKEIVDFKTGFLVGEPIQYISTSADATVSENVALLNKMLKIRGKATQDKQLIDWDMICGTAYRLVLPSVDEDIPFKMYTPNPATTFCIYKDDVTHEKLAGVIITQSKANTVNFTVYTPEYRYVIVEDGIVDITPNTMGVVPIVEYEANASMLGAFEPVVSMLDAINLIDSDRVDGIEQFIQSLLIIYNADLDDDVTADTIRQSGMIKLKSFGDKDADIKILSEQLNQTQTQTLKDDLYNAVLTICSMPNRNGGSSTSDTGIAVVYRDGWSAAETSAKGSELMYYEADQEFIKIILDLCRTKNIMDLHPSDIEPHFGRRNADNNATKVQTLVAMLGCEKLDPKLAFQYSGMFPDPEEAYRMSVPYMNKTTEEVTKTVTEEETEEVVNEA